MLYLGKFVDRDLLEELGFDQDNLNPLQNLSIQILTYYFENLNGPDGVRYLLEKTYTDWNYVRLVLGASDKLPKNQFRRLAQHILRWVYVSDPSKEKIQEKIERLEFLIIRDSEIETK